MISEVAAMGKFVEGDTGGASGIPVMFFLLAFYSLTWVVIYMGVLTVINSSSCSLMSCTFSACISFLSFKNILIRLSKA